MSIVNQNNRGRLWGAASVLVIVLAILVARFAPPVPPLDWVAITTAAAQYYGNDAARPLHNVTVLVTGATSGLGLGLVQTMVRLGAGTVIVAGRHPDKLRAVCHDLRQQQQHEDTTNILPLVMDQANLTSVAVAAERLPQQVSHIDVLINNAGMHDGPHNIMGTARTMNGMDVVFVVNYLSHVLLTEKLTPLLLSNSSHKNHNKPIVLHMASSYHWVSDGRDLQPKQQHDNDNDDGPKEEAAAFLPASAVGGGVPAHAALFRSQRSYANSKLAQIVQGRAYQRRQDNQVRVVSVCPGWVATNISHPIVTMLGYPANGFGLSSVLYGLWNDDAPQQSDKPDYYINSPVYGVFTKLFAESVPSWLHYGILRDINGYLLAGTTNVVQWLWPSPTPHATRSSPQSYQRDLQDQLDAWSLQALRDYL